jgi:hypothetical protein
MSAVDGALPLPMIARCACAGVGQRPAPRGLRTLKESHEHRHSTRALRNSGAS